MGVERNWDTISQDIPEDISLRITAILQTRIFTESCIIYLGGSWAAGTAAKDSDVDLLIIVQTVQKRKDLNQIVRKYYDSIKDNRAKIDFKILTAEELRKAWNGDNHFSIWAFLKNSILIHGEDIRHQYSNDWHNQ